MSQPTLKYTVVDPRGQPPARHQMPMAPRLDTLNNKTVYIVVKRVSGSGSFTLSAEATKTGTPSNSFTFPFGIPYITWIVLSTIGLTSMILLAKKRKQ